MKALLQFFLTIPSTLFGGFIFAHLWNWFIVRKFTSAPTLTFLDAVGILLTVGFPLLSLHMSVNMQTLQKEHNDVDSSTLGILVTLLTIFVLYPIIFGTAFLWHLVIGN